jgi:hypothetical protein
MINSDWSYDSLYTKAQVSMERAFLADRNSSLFPFWASLGLELIARATLSKIHPALISDPREGNNILHAFGYGSSKEPPKTIGAKTIFLRLQVIIPTFTKDDEKFCQSFINMRNEELHTGTPIFEDYPTNSWLTKFYKATKILLEFQGKTLEDFIGKQESEIAEHMISEFKEELIAKVFEKIKKYRDVHNDLEKAEREIKEAVSPKLLSEYVLKEKLYGKSKKVKCPSCNVDALLIGKFISQSEPKVNEDVITVSNNMLPIELKCFACGIKLTSNGELSVANYGGQFAIESNVDPVEYYGIEYDPIEELKSRGYGYSDLIDDFPEFEYGND